MFNLYNLYMNDQKADVNHDDGEAENFYGGSDSMKMHCKLAQSWHSSRSGFHGAWCSVFYPHYRQTKSLDSHLIVK